MNLRIRTYPLSSLITSYNKVIVRRVTKLSWSLCYFISFYIKFQSYFFFYLCSSQNTVFNIIFGFPHPFSHENADCTIDQGNTYQLENALLLNSQRSILFNNAWTWCLEPQSNTCCWQKVGSCCIFNVVLLPDGIVTAKAS